MHTTELYFECHLTFEPIHDPARLNDLKNYVKPYGFRVAELVMMKSGEQHREDAFMTCRSTNFADIEYKMVNCIHMLRARGFKMLRYKIENTLLDSKFSDTLGLLPV